VPRRSFTLLAVLAVCWGLAGCRAEYDLAIVNGQILDGTGAPPRRADLGIKRDRIFVIGELGGKRAARTIDAAGLVVAPGFIDVQGQSGLTLLTDGNGESHVRQGITSEIIGESSTPGLWTRETADHEFLQSIGMTFDWTGFDGYLRTLERRGTSINVGSFIPANIVRRDVIGLENRSATPEELQRMISVVEQSMRQGGIGLSSALIYPPGAYSSTEELIALSTAAAKHGGIYISHVRGESFRVKEAIAEAMEIGDRAGLPVVIYHLKVAARKYWGTMDEVAGLIEQARTRGANVSACQYPYTAGGTSLAASLPGWAQEGGREKMLERLGDPAQRARIRRDIETTIDSWENLVAAAGFEGIQIASVPPERDQSVIGKRIAQIAAERRQDPWDTFFSLLLDNEARVSALYHMMSEEDLKTAMRYPWVTIGTDAAALKPDGPLGRGQPHPRAYGTFPRILGRYVREQRVLTLPEAVRRMTGLAAEQMRIRERGLLRPGYFADVVVFNPETVSDRATYEQPHQYPVGIEYVIVNGVVTIERGEHTSARAGRALLGPGYQPRAGT
jgi:N-acyl-D-aspartate/D-glutamate deacylase